jgi:hypothetical protein
MIGRGLPAVTSMRMLFFPARIGAGSCPSLDGGSGLFFRVLRDPFDQAAVGAAKDHVGRLPDPLGQMEGGMQIRAAALAGAGGRAGRSMVFGHDPLSSQSAVWALLVALSIRRMARRVAP